MSIRPVERLVKAGFALAICLALCLPQRAAGQAGRAVSRFEVSYPASLEAGPVTGRLFVIVTRSNRGEPRLQAGSYGRAVPFFGSDVDAWKAGESAVMDASVPGYPLESLADLPAGDYYVQALLNIYTQVHRRDGHTIWVHLDQWEGQQWNRSPGNLVSEVRQVHLDPAAGFNIKLSLTDRIPPIEVPEDTPWVKHVKIQSRMLSDFWGVPVYLGATVLLPKGWAENPDWTYPAIYIQDHFSLRAPFGFSDSGGRGGRSGLSDLWMSDEFPRLIAVTFQHPTPYYDDSYAVNSANNGPYEDALLQELIPYLEQHFRIVARPEGRVLTGGSTGGWEALALQVHRPEFFNGAWVFYPDPIDFRRYQMSNIFQDENAFEVPNGEWATLVRPLSRDVSGQVTLTMRDMCRLESVLGSHVRSGQQIAAWDAAYGPVGGDGYPRPLWDRKTGKIDREVAAYMRDHGYDLSWYVKEHWPSIGKDLTGKIHLFVGDMDNYYLNLAVYLFEEMARGLQDPPAEAEFQYGRPLQGHGWSPYSSLELVRLMAEHIDRTAPGLVIHR
jgi:hypothetical protein